MFSQFAGQAGPGRAWPGQAGLGRAGPGRAGLGCWVGRREVSALVGTYS